MVVLDALAFATSCAIGRAERYAARANFYQPLASAARQRAPHSPCAQMGNKASASVPPVGVFEIAAESSGSVPQLNNNALLYLFSNDYDYLQSFVLASGLC